MTAEDHAIIVAYLKTGSVERAARELSLPSFRVRRLIETTGYSLGRGHLQAAARWSLAERDEHIRALREQGLTQKEIGREVGLREGTIQKILSSNRGTSK